MDKTERAGAYQSFDGKVCWSMGSAFDGAFNDDGWTKLMIASFKGDVCGVHSLIHSRTNVNQGDGQH